MKTFFFFGFLIVFVVLAKGNIYSQVNELKKLTITNSQIDSVVCNLILKERQKTNVQLEAFVIKIEKIENELIFKIASVDSIRIREYVNEKKGSILGYIECQGSYVFVLSDSLFKVFGEEKMIKAFEFLKPCKKAIDDVDTPPEVYEPIVHIYKLKNGIITLVKVGRFFLI